jgi:hypothetical protein
MKFLDKLFKKPKPVVKEPTPIPKIPKKTAKEIATEQGEPYINIVSMEIDPNNLHQGAFELDWNDKFVTNLIRAGYQMKGDDTDADIVDRWFQNVCRHVVMETWEQEEAMRNSGIYVKTTDLGNGRKEVS